jgi:two-component system phosphate regulon sensor histidine kinase PhoR
MNLFINSIKYSTKDPIIKIETENRPGVIVTSITDNGIGIPQKEQKKIFDKYYRITNGDLHNTKGFGIGLYFAKKVVEAHGGNIDVKSEEGFGSTFIISLPLYKIES